MDPKHLSPVAFLAPTQFGKPGEGARHFSGVAYGGGVVTDHPFFTRVAFDLESTELETPAPALYMHTAPVGVIKTAVINGKIEISGELFSDIDDNARSIVTKADRGMPWQMSVGIFPGRTEEVKPGSSVLLNGATLEGPLTVFRDNRIREVSFCPLGADHTTGVRVFSFIGSTQPRQQEQPMSTIERAEHDRIVNDLNDKLKAANDATAALRAQFEAKAKADRIAAVKALFAATKRDYTDDAAKAYVEMSDEAFTAVDRDLRASFKPKLDRSLTTEQATSGGDGNETAPKTAAEFQAAAVKYIAEQKAVNVTVDPATAIAHVKKQFAAAA